MRLAAKVSACALAIMVGLFVAPLAVYGQPASPAITVRTIEVRGNSRVDRSTILFYVGLSEGKAYTNVELVERIREDVRTVYGLGFFRDVQVGVEPFEGGLKVIYNVSEKPTINSIQVVGNSNVEMEKIRETMTIKAQTIINEATVKETVRNIRKLYQEKGYYFTRIEAVLKEGSQNTVAVTLRIDEGESVEIETITFRGNDSIKKKDLLSAMETTEWGIFSFITESGIFKEDALQKDLVRIRILYQSRGFLNVQVGQPIVREDRERGKLNISIPISEGFSYRLKEIEIRGGEDVIPPEEIKRKLDLFPGDVLNRTVMIGDVRRITNMFSERGYAFADIRPSTTTDDKKKTVVVRIDINKGRRVYIGKVNLKGNTRTRENVIRREMRVAEGSLYDSQGLSITRSRINRLGYFSTVNVVEKRREGSDDILDIDIELKEQPTGSILGGLGFNSREGAILTGQIRENNLFGRGYQAAIEVRFSDVSKDFIGSIDDPNFLDKNFSLGVDAFFADRDFITFQTRSEGGRVRAGKELANFLIGSVTYELSTSRIFQVDETAPLSFREQENDTLVSSIITPSLVYDSRNRRLMPSKGTFARLVPSFSGGPLGGDVDVISFLAEFRRWYNVGETFRLRLLKKLVWAVRVRGRYVDAFSG
ncbi:MAG: outer membrane protein assembly factor BamA, partial [bacterium]